MLVRVVCSLHTSEPGMQQQCSSPHCSSMLHTTKQHILYEAIQIRGTRILKADLSLILLSNETMMTLSWIINCLQSSPLNPNVVCQLVS